VIVLQYTPALQLRGLILQINPPIGYTQKRSSMKAATERKIIRWLHIVASIPIIGYIYGPVKDIPNAVMMIKWVLFPLIVFSGLWLWKGHWVRKKLRQVKSQTSNVKNPRAQ
jgi:hypothetical protein